EVVLCHHAESGGGSLEACRLDLLARTSVSDPNDLREFQEGRVGQPVLPDNRVEAHELLSAVLVMVELGTRRVERARRVRVRALHHLVFGDVKKFRILVNELSNQPRTRDPVDPRLLPSYPLHRDLAPGCSGAYKHDGEPRSVPYSLRWSRGGHTIRGSMRK